MKAAVVVYPGSNCDRDMKMALEGVGFDVTMVWHKDAELPQGLDFVAVPGGFSFGDYLRCGAIAARSPVSQSIADFAAKGGHVLGVCNGFQVLTEAGLLPGALLRNAGLKYICRTVGLKVETTSSVFTNAYTQDQVINIPIAHHDGNYNASADEIARLRGENRVAFSYVDNPNGSQGDIAGILSENRRVLGMMPHPERAFEPAHGNTDGKPFFASLIEAMATA